MSKPKVLITGASSGIGAVYADRFAKRGHDLVLVARDQARLDALAERLRDQTGESVEVVRADLATEANIAAVETRLRDDATIGVLINNAGLSIAGSFDTQPSADLARLVAVNATAVMRLAHAVAPRFVAAGEGAIVNLGSVVGFVPEFGQTVYGATKAFVLFLSQGLAYELGPKGVYVQAVVPAATATDIWSRAGADASQIPPLMAVDALVDAALVGFDRREGVTIPPLHDGALWDAYQADRAAMIPGFGETAPAPRYTETVA
ncbi:MULTISPECIES: SDR family NAD(P)-dependent oxidoreductase [unclassified Sphingomonas]|uniref:SDR family NAD(P)-dependent oxidoreductase n=1 Tax=unclassified Sphingomonas TaxID=196159 RepID=UPI0006F96222|nr:MULTISPECIES: SDR family oxidoreductase [unclassified Sphingomonas]KQM23899.1 AraC family transcriptional regulator [Sphingomonas sp. Leaf9]KQM42027.1 AraC family transcriptional regulator [Sphingomonas sp. Leaf11]